MFSHTYDTCTLVVCDHEYCYFLPRFGLLHNTTHWGKIERSGSGSHENVRPFKIIAMEKQVQTSIMHQKRFGERERFANETSQTLPECIIPAFNVRCFTCFLPYCCVLLFWNHCLVSRPKISKAMSRAIGFWDSIPQNLTGYFTPISDCVCNYLTRFPTQCDPDPRLISLFQHK